MKTLFWLLTALNLVAVSCAWWAATMARSHLRVLRRKLAERSTRSLRQLDAEIVSLSTAVSSISTTVKRLSSRVGMRDVRERRKEELESMPANLTPAEKKAWLRRGLQRGSLQIVRDGAGAPTGQSTGRTTADDV